MKTVKVEYIESGTFVGGEEDTFLAGIERGEECVVLKVADFEKLKAAQKALKAARSILWMAEKYAEAGGSHGPEMIDYNKAMEIIEKAK